MKVRLVEVNSVDVMPVFAFNDLGNDHSHSKVTAVESCLKGLRSLAVKQKPFKSFEVFAFCVIMSRR